MELDEETLETLGYGAEKALRDIAKKLTKNRAEYNEYMRLYMQQWRKDNPKATKIINKRAKLKAKLKKGKRGTTKANSTTKK
jgi:hypothetical protein